MQRSIFLAKLMGPAFVAVGLGMRINRGIYESMSFKGYRQHA